jgi:hypothetical protein
MVILTPMPGMTPDEIALLPTLDVSVVLLAVVTALGVWIQR